MASALPKVDVSTRWPAHTCGATHLPAVACPPRGVWLVLALCGTCKPKIEYYCATHRGRP